MTILKSHPAFLSEAKRVQHAVLGAQSPLYYAECPAGASALVGTPLVGSTITVDGDYVILIPLWGIVSTLKVYLLPQLTSMTLESTALATLHLFDPTVTNVADAVALTAGTGIGALSDNTLQTLTLTGMLGEQYARLILAAGAAPTSVTFDIAEFIGI